MLAQVYTCAVIGLEGEIVQVEVDTGRGLPSFTLVGLPDAAVKESAERVRAAIKNSGLVMHGGRLTVNLAPADLRKAGPSYDLPIAIGVLAATGQIPVDSLEGALVVGELGLDGAVRDLSNFALQLHGKPSSMAAQMDYCLKLIRKPVADEARYQRVWSQVLAHNDAYEMNP